MRRAAVAQDRIGRHADGQSLTTCLTRARVIQLHLHRCRPPFLLGYDNNVDVLACPQCGGRMVLLATIEDPTVITRILTHLGLSLESGEPDPAHPPPEIDGVAGA